MNFRPCSSASVIPLGATFEPRFKQSHSRNLPASRPSTLPIRKGPKNICLDARSVNSFVRQLRQYLTKRLTAQRRYWETHQRYGVSVKSQPVIEPAIVSAHALPADHEGGRPHWLQARLPFTTANLSVTQILPAPERITFLVQPLSRTAACVRCGQSSRRAHSVHQRRLRDLPWLRADGRGLRPLVPVRVFEPLLLPLHLCRTLERHGTTIRPPYHPTGRDPAIHCSRNRERAWHACPVAWQSQPTPVRYCGCSCARRRTSR